MLSAYLYSYRVLKKFNQFDKKLEESGYHKLDHNTDQKKIMKEIVFPNKIKKGSTIAVITPAGAIEPGQLDKTLELIKSKGFTNLF